jgi:nitrogen fixation protein FixH
MPFAVQAGSSRSGRWIPWLFIAGFLVVIAVNAVLIVTATSSFSGLVVSQPYKKGVEYNQTRAQIEAQEQLGWRYSFGTATDAQGGALLTMQWMDRAGSALDRLTIEAELQRPVENLPSLPVTFQSAGNGRYVASVKVPKTGVWDLHLEARQDGAQFVAAERVILP